eukprot:scaffold26402_cov117-Cylindrotheca_fusiformis.AAC.1
MRPWRKVDLRLRMNIDSDDPFQVLGLDEPTTDKKVIKRAYKRMALKYHPDVSSTKDSTPEEKKKASDQFAKINWAYSVLSGKSKDDSAYNSKGTKSSGSSSSSSASGWTPPHRRTGQSYTSQRSYTDNNVSWEDFMPKSEQTYDSDGDSYGKIFSDLLSTAAATKNVGSAVFKDFIEFLESNIDGYGGSGDSDDGELRILLNTGSKADIRNELDDTELVVNQLRTKLNGINNDISSVTSEMTTTTKYLDKMGLEETLAELNARKNVVAGYLKRAQKRLLTLQTRYQEMMSRNSNFDSSYAGQSRQTTWEDIKRESNSSPYASEASSGYTSSSEGNSRSNGDSWKKEGFGSSSRGSARGSRRRQSATRTQGSSSDEEQSFKSSASGESARKESWMNEGFSNRGRGSTRGREGNSGNSGAGQPDSVNRRESTYSSNSEANSSRNRGRDTASSRSSASNDIPPHRRTSFGSNQNEEKRRLREIKVDEEFEKLKRELGLK